MEIVLKTIVDLASAIAWLKSTFLYTRIVKNPVHYGIATTDKAKQTFELRVEEYLKGLCVRNLGALMECTLIERCDFISDERAQLTPTSNGQLLAKYSLAFKTMESIIGQLEYRRVDQRPMVQQPSMSIQHLVGLLIKLFLFLFKLE